MTVTEGQIKSFHDDVYEAAKSGYGLRQARRKVCRDWAKRGVSNVDEVHKAWRKTVTIFETENIMAVDSTIL